MQEEEEEEEEVAEEEVVERDATAEATSDCKCGDGRQANEANTPYLLRCKVKKEMNASTQGNIEVGGGGRGLIYHDSSACMEPGEP
jgi:hypothetical protein